MVVHSLAVGQTIAGLAGRSQENLRGAAGASDAGLAKHEILRFA